MEKSFLSAKQASELLAKREISSRELTQTYLDRIEQGNPKTNAFVFVDAQRAIEQATRADKRRAEGDSAPLLGVPFATKDIVCTQGMKTTCGSASLQSFVPPYDAHVIEKLDGAGMVLLGKTNMDEFAMGGSTETSIFGSTRNPWDTSRTAGGSSGGSAAAVAANLAPLSIGSDTGGSIRQPASFCGICGLKPTYGRVSRYGLIAFASSLDQLGPMANTVEDLALFLQAFAGWDRRDSTSVNAPVPDFATTLCKPSTPPRIGVVRQQLDHQGLPDEVRSAIESAIEVYRAAGSRIVEIDLPHADYSIPAYYIIAPSEASSNLSRYDGAHYGTRSARSASAKSESPLIEMYCNSRSEGFGSEVKRRIMLGTYALSAGYYEAYYLKALKVRRLIRQDYDRAFEKVDVLVGPTTPGPAFRLGEKLDDPIQMYLEDLFTVGANLAGIPALSIPCGKTREGLPIGLQLQAPALAEPLLLQAGHWYHSLVDHQPEFVELT
jgi:aspartyl-tRNA(Asn)/glutamyl-tRNA(Gln) amidotransferase subunit A